MVKFFSVPIEETGRRETARKVGRPCVCEFRRSRRARNVVFHGFAFLLSSQNGGHPLSHASVITAIAIILTHTKQVRKTVVRFLRLFIRAVVVGNFAEASHYQSIRGDIAAVRIH